MATDIEYEGKKSKSNGNRFFLAAAPINHASKIEKKAAISSQIGVISTNSLFF